jgi:hypothetical protein
MKFDKGYLDRVKNLSLPEFEKEFHLLKDHWNLIKTQGDFPLREYTDQLIEDSIARLKICISKDDEIRAISVRDAFTLLAKIHLVEKSLTPSSVLIFSNSGDKIKNFTVIIPHLTDSDYWKLLGVAYIEQNYSSVDSAILWNLFNSPRPNREQLMNVEEREHLVSLPETFTIYRAMSIKEFDSQNYRFSWTLNEDVASKFARTNKMIYDQETKVVQITAQKEFVIAYFNERDEEEIIYDYSKSVNAR